MHDLRVLWIGGSLVVTILWAVEYFILGQGKLESVVIFPVCFGSGLFVVWLLVLAITLYRKGLSIRRYGELSEAEATELHDRIADSVLGPKKS